MKPMTDKATTGPVLTRREFLAGSTVAAMAVATGPVRGAVSANATIGVGLIGCGDRGGALVDELLGVASRHGVRVVGLCDVWQRNLERTSARVAQKQETTPKGTSRFRELLARSEVDAVIIATPDFSHGEILVAALEAGKDVYIEKPMTIDVASANRAMDVAREKQRVVQVGTQRRSDGRFRAAARLAGEGILGSLSRVTAEVNFNHARWLRSMEDCRADEVDWEAFLLHLADRPFDASLLRRWQLHRDTSNGMPGLWMTHYADAVHMLTGATYPKAAVALGGIYVWKDGREHTDTFRTVLEYPEGFLFTWGMGLGNAHGMQFTLHGRQGTLDVEGWKVIPEAGVAGAPEARSIAPEGGRGHMEDWVRALRERGGNTAPIETGHQHVVATVMAAKALESGQRQRYDIERREILPG